MSEITLIEGAFLDVCGTGREDVACAKDCCAGSIDNEAPAGGRVASSMLRGRYRRLVRQRSSVVDADCLLNGNTPYSWLTAPGCSAMEWRYDELRESEREELAPLSKDVSKIVPHLRDLIHNQISAGGRHQLLSRLGHLERILHQYDHKLSNRFDSLNNARRCLEDLANDVDSYLKLADPGHRLLIRKQMEAILHLASMASTKITRMEARVSSIIDRQSLVPGDQPAPIHVRIIDDVLTRVNPKDAVEGSLSKEALDAIRSTCVGLLSSGIEQLESGTNVDRRALRTLRDLKDHLDAGYDHVSIEAIGIYSELAADICKHIRDEVPDITFRILLKSLDNIEVLLSQYKQWGDYKRAAKRLSVDHDAFEGALAGARDLSADLASFRDVVDVSVSHALTELLRGTEGLVYYMDSSIVPMMGSLSNILAALARFMLENVHSATRFVEAEAGLVPTSCSYAMFACALYILRKYSSAFERCPPLMFVRKSIVYAEAQFPWLKKIV